MGGVESGEERGMNYIIEFWNPWRNQWQRWNMQPTTETAASHMMHTRRLIDDTMERRIVEVGSCE